MQRRRILIPAGIVALGVGFYLFRPDRLFIDASVNEELPAATTMQTASASNSPRTLLQGGFRGVAHATDGTATIHQLADGKRVLRFTNFRTSNGPDLQVYLVAAEDARDNATVKRAGFVSLGAIKGNVGNQNYDVPADVDLEKYRAVTIWCRRFSVNFATAPLAPPSEDATAAGPTPLAMGKFHGVAHATDGSATVYQLPDGKRVLRFTDFRTSNGPDVQVYLVAAEDARDNATVKRAGFISLGAIKGNVGNQNYDVPADVDLTKYRAVTIWCRRFGVNFATAPLQSQST